MQDVSATDSLYDAESVSSYTFDDYKVKLGYSLDTRLTDNGDKPREDLYHLMHLQELVRPRNCNRLDELVIIYCERADLKGNCVNDCKCHMKQPIGIAARKTLLDN